MSFFFMKKTSVPQGDTLCLINPLARRSCNWIFNYISSGTAIWYRFVDTSAAPGTNSMEKSISSLCGNLGIFFGNIS